MSDTNSINKSVKRANSEGFNVSEYSVRKWIKEGVIPVRKVGNKALLYYPNLVKFLKCEDGADNTPPTMKTISGIRRVDM